MRAVFSAAFLLPGMKMINPSPPLESTYLFQREGREGREERGEGGKGGERGCVVCSLIYTLGISIQDFTKWEKKMTMHFSSWQWILHEGMTLSSSLNKETKAYQLIQEYGSKRLKLDVQNIWERGGGGVKGGEGQNLREIEYEESQDTVEDQYENEDDFEDDEEEEGEGENKNEEEKDEEMDEEGKKDNTISVHKYQQYFRSPITHNTTTQVVPNCQNDCAELEKLQAPQSFLQFDLECFQKLQSPLPHIITKRLSSIPKGTLSNHPLTTRSVERMFSYWKRLMGRNVETKTHTMQAILLLSCFTFENILKILKEYPTTPAITKFIQTLTSTNTKNCLDAAAYYKMKAKTTKLKQQTILKQHLTSLRTKYSLPQPQHNQKFWTKDHSIQYLKASQQTISNTNIQKLSANFLLHYILKQTTQSYQHYENVSLPCPPLPTPLPQTSEPLTLTYIVEKEKENKKGMLYEVERVESHKKGKSRYDYCVKWEGYEDVTWEKEDNLANTSILTEYWKNKVDEMGIVKETRQKRKEDGYDGDEREYDVEKILDHEKYEGDVFFYKVEWSGGKVEEGKTCTWIPESNFEGGKEVMLREYWKSVYVEEERKITKEARKKKG
jgi:hypothetical protein